MNKIIIVILFALMACTDDHLAPISPGTPIKDPQVGPNFICESAHLWTFEQFNYAQPLTNIEYSWTSLKIQPDFYSPTTQTQIKVRITNTGTVKMAYKRVSIGSYIDLVPGAYAEWVILVAASGSSCTNVTDKQINIWVKLRECRQSGCSWGAQLSLTSATNGHTVGNVNPGFTVIVQPNSCPSGVTIVP